jgi:hypothetical protein
MNTPKAYKRSNQSGEQKTKFLDWFKQKNDLKFQRPFALITPNFVNACVSGDDVTYTIVPTSTFEKLLKDLQPRLLTRESMGNLPELTTALEQIWRRMPRFCLIVPVKESSAYSIALLGRQQQPEPALLAKLVSALEERAFEANVLHVRDLEEMKEWNRNTEPTIIVDLQGRPVLLNAAATSFYGDSRTTHLENLLGRLTAVQLQQKKEQLVEYGQLQFDARLELAHGTWLTEIDVTVMHKCLALVLTNLKEIHEFVPSLPPSMDGGKLGTLQSRRSSIMIAKGSILCWIHCDPLPPLAVGPKFEMTLGRHEHNDLTLPHPAVSRAHAAIKVRGPTVVIEDLSSANGTYINGRRRDSHTICIDDRIQIGPYEMIIRAPQVRDTIKNSETTIHTQIRFLNRDADLTGSLLKTPLLELLQSLEFNQKTGTLSVINGRVEAYFTVLEGRAHSAQMGELTDLEAVLALLQIEEGHFTFSNQKPKNEKTMKTTITSILLEASRRIDEKDL